MKKSTLEGEMSTLEHYRVHINEYDRWLAEFPDVCRVLENLKAQSEWHSGLRPVDVSELRNELRKMRGATPAAAGASEQDAGTCFFCGESMGGKHEADCPQGNVVAGESDETPAAYLVTIGGHPSLQFSWIDPANLAKGNTCEPLYTQPSAEIAALRERIAGMEKDAERLDWLTSNEHMRLKDSSDGYVVWDCGNGLEIAGTGATIREAIDAAIAKEKPCAN